jgi:hypothetical protein
MKILLYFFFRLNKIIATNLKKNNSIFLNFYKNLFKKEKINLEVLNNINNFFIFKNFFLTLLLKKKLFFKEKKKKKKFFFFKIKAKKTNFFSFKKSFFFFFKNIKNFNFFNFFNFFFLIKIFFNISLKNYLKTILDTDNKKVIYSYFFLYLKKFRKYDQNIKLSFFNINKISDF